MHGTFDELKNEILALKAYEMLSIATQEHDFLVTNLPDENSRAPIDFRVNCHNRYPQDEADRIQSIMKSSNITHVMALIIGVMCQESEGFSDRLEPVVWGRMNSNG